jgi:xanthine dehydrogenase YagR molybdenum-binding subunit
MSGWPKNPKQLGKEHERYDGPVKVSGSARFASDMQPTGWLYAMILRSPWPAARIRTIDLRQALDVPGIRAAVTANEPPFTVRYCGEELAGVAGISKQVCLDALRAIKVEADLLPFVVKEEAALRDTSPRVFENRPNAGEPREMQTGEVNAAFELPIKQWRDSFKRKCSCTTALRRMGTRFKLRQMESRVGPQLRGFLA